MKHSITPACLFKRRIARVRRLILSRLSPDWKFVTDLLRDIRAGEGGGTVLLGLLRSGKIETRRHNVDGTLFSQYRLAGGGGL